ncbi:MAG: helix-turn-helix domain-containing protein [Actinomycetota bacterium]|jgi:predicted ArsR family transcriptional regulator|nr:helix-turn-helix domain-containing protein [Actinomycetota bacterium]
MNSREDQISAVAALDEPTRRRLYNYVLRQSEPVSRDDAAMALGLPRSTVGFHLDRLVEQRLLDSGYQRLTGRSGPGAGRPAKLYSRSSHQVTVSMPPRCYELAGQLLSNALAHAERSKQSPRAILNERAYEMGKALGETARSATGSHNNTLKAALRLLEDNGFQPRIEDNDVILGNCPFHTLAQDHKELICGMNLRLLNGVVDGLAPDELTAQLRGTPTQCCVRLAYAAEG